MPANAERQRSSVNFNNVHCPQRAQTLRPQIINRPTATIIEEFSMTYFVTGATGFVGKFLVTNLLKRDSGKAGTIYVL
ncbi:MAG: SDR family oxidoreductase, partial [Burkholderiales bacterium]